MFQFLWRHKIYTIIVLIILAIVGYSMYKKAHSVPQLTFDKVTRTTVIDTVSESGNLILEGQANITAPAEGIVEKIFIKNNDYVYSGQALFTAKSTATDQDKTTALASLLSAQNNTLLASQAKGTTIAGVDSAKQAVYNTQVNYNNIARWYSLLARNAATGRRYTQAEVDSAAAALSAAGQNLVVAEQKLTDANTAIEAAQKTEEAAKLNYEAKDTFTVKAPASGTISNIKMNPGDKVSSLAANSPLMIISQSKNLLFTTQINENEIIKLTPDQIATITVDAIKEKTFKGKIKNIDSVGTNTAGVITYNVYFTLDETSDNLRSGMSGNVDVEVTRHENVLTVANAAVKPYQDGKAVQVVDTTKPKKNNQPELKYIPVKTGIKTSDRTEILEGLTEDMEVVINNTSNQFKSSLFGG